MAELCLTPLSGKCLSLGQGWLEFLQTKNTIFQEQGTRVSSLDQRILVKVLTPLSLVVTAHNHRGALELLNSKI